MAPLGGGGLGDAFRSQDFDVAAFVRDATSQGQDSVAKVSQRLEDYTREIDEELRRQIVACHDELLRNAGSVEHLDSELGGVREVVDALKASVVRVRLDVLAPFHDVRRRAALLERVQAVNVLIRKLLRFLFDARKLRTQMDASTRDYSKAAHTLFELEAVLKESSLVRIEVLGPEIAWIRETGAKIRKQAEEDLKAGTAQGNQLVLSTALQVFFNLHSLWPQLHKMLAGMLDDLNRTHLMPGAQLQQSLDVNLQVVAQNVLRIYVLDELIRSKTDPLTHRTFSAALEDEGVASLVAHFWKEATVAITAKFARLAQDRSARRTLLAEIPKVLHTMTEVIDKVNLSSRGRGQILRAAEREAMYATVQELRNEYLAESIRRVSEPVEMMLPDRLLNALGASGEQLSGAGGEGSSLSEELPTTHDLKRYIQLLVAELERNECCPDLLLKEAVRSVRSSVLLFVTRLEQVVDTSCGEPRCLDDSCLRLVTPLPTPSAGHARNARIFGIAYHVNALLRDSIPARFQAVILTQQVAENLRQMQSGIVSPMVSVLRRMIRAISVQLEGSLKDRTNDGSAAILALSQLAAHINRHYFALYGTGQLVPYVKDCCVYVVRTYLSAAVLVKPLTDEARAALAQDMLTIEAALATLDGEFSAHIRHEASVFKELRKIFLEPAPPGPAELKEMSNVVPAALLLAHLAHTLPPAVPSLPAAAGLGFGEYLETVMAPLWAEEPSAMCSFRASVAVLAAQAAKSGPSPVAAFLSEQTRPGA